ncbi:MAG: STAS/SEC14 domain-containing protein [Alphaproteobacteria bacterium]|nr:STAS/SEC14 domain-containing protein [Alphaproteobacteria bacterium]
MFEIQPESQGNFLSLCVVGKLTDGDYKRFCPHLDALVAEHGCVRCLIDMTAFEGMTMGAAWEDFILGVRHWNDFERCALIGDTAWEKASAVAFNALSKSDVRYFTAKERREAWIWVKGRA